MTSGGLLKAKHVIHTVGPVWRGGTKGECELLAEAYQNSLKLAVANDLQSIAFPSISTGAYGFPIELAGKIALETVKTFFEKKGTINDVVFVLFSASDFALYIRLANDVFGQK